MVGKPLPCPGQRTVKVRRAIAALLISAEDDAFGSLLAHFDQQHVARMAFDKSCN